MKQTFLKTITGRTLEFNRLLYPLKYNILFHSFETPGIMIFVNKEDNGRWNIKSLENMPWWVSEISPNIVDAINENENLFSNAQA